MSHRIVLVGQCGVDGPRIEREIARAFQDAKVINAEDDQSLQVACEQGADLLLINRQLPYGFESEEGVDIVRGLREKHADLKMMLISDYAEAQSEARDAGALPGFGKAQLGTGEVEQVLRQALP